MHSIDELKVQEYLKQRRARFVTSIRTLPNSDVLVLTVPESAFGKVASSTMTSRRQLNFLKKAIERNLGLTVEFIVSREKVSEDMEAGLNALLQTHHPGAFQGCFTSLLESGTVDVWLERSTIGAEVSASDVEHAIRAYLQVFGTKLGVVHWVGARELPSATVILRELKILSPALPSNLAQRLEAKGFRVPPNLWLQRELDRVRKQQLAIRREDGCYILTESGLSAVPHWKGRQGSDVERALALGKRRW